MSHGAPLRHVDLFNWYLSDAQGQGRIVVCGDACTVEMRHAEFLAEKQRGASSLEIAKKDRSWRSTHPSQRREFEWIHQAPVVHIDADDIVTCRNTAFRLINMDPYFQQPAQHKRQIVLYERAGGTIP
jgi:hypothetical protein